MLPSEPMLKWQNRLHSLFLALPNRLFRVTPRMLLILIISSLFTLFVILPGRLPESTVGSKFTNYLHSGTTKSGHGGNGLRVVVFGSPNVASSQASEKGTTKSWSEQLCNRIEPNPFITLNNIWDDALEEVAVKYNGVRGQNYTHIRSNPPVSAYKDMSTQVRQFLETKPAHPSFRETIWVFDFGMWDIWQLAALPREIGEQYVDKIVVKLFAQVERLYQKSLDERSNAYSDFWQHAPTSLLEKLKDTDTTWDPKEVESFRVIIPKVFDISATPGWVSIRPEPPKPHSKVEDVRNALHLVDRWNNGIQSYADRWMNTANPESPVHSSDETATQNPTLRNTGSSISVPYPTRRVYILDSPSHIFDAIIERQWRDANMSDSTGRGKQDSPVLLYDNVVDPCIHQKSDDTAVDPSQTVVCDNINEYIWHTPFTVSQRVIDTLSGIAYVGVRDVLHLPLQEQKP